MIFRTLYFFTNLSSKYKCIKRRMFIQKIGLPIVWVIKMELAILREGTLALKLCLPSWMLFHLGKKSCLFSTVSFRLIIPKEWWYTWDIFENLYIFKQNIFFSSNDRKSGQCLSSRNFFFWFAFLLVSHSCYFVDFFP